jgi:hypothetical protein
MIKNIILGSFACLISNITFTQNVSEGFEGSFPPSGWSVINNNVNTDDDWRAQTAITIGTSSITPFEGNKYAASYSVTGGFGIIPDNWLVTPQLSINASNSSLNFSALGATTYGEWTAPGEYLEVLVSTTGNAINDFTTSLWSNRFDQAATWIQFSVSLAAYNGQNIYLAFKHHDSYNEYFVAVDAITITDASIAGGGVIDNDGDGYNSTVDCNDNDNTIYPGAPEICDSKDNDCDGQIDEGLATTTYFLDADLDGYGTGTGVAYCANPGSGYTTATGDCNDNNAAINPGATDIPGNGIDEDCNGSDATASGITADNDNGTCVQNGTPAIISILDGDFINGAAASIVNAEVDIDLTTAGFQNTKNNTSPNVSWAFDNTFFGVLTCTPGTDVVGTVTLDYKVCDKLNPTDCSNTATVSVVVTPSSVSLGENSLVYSLFPNPAKETITITSNSKIEKVKLTTLEGKEVLISSLIDKQINVNGLSNGIYQVEVTFENGTVGRSTFVKE